jgi:uncharacterized protein (TIGR02453 family)
LIVANAPQQDYIGVCEDRTSGDDAWSRLRASRGRRRQPCGLGRGRLEVFSARQIRLGRNMTFQGFGPEAQRFFKALSFHQTREWFEENREVYDASVKAPMGELVEETVERLARAGIPIKGDRKSSLFRIHRDVRFSKNKDPYKTNAGVLLTRTGAKSDSGVLYFHLSPEECFFAAGFHMPEPHELARLREAAVRAPKAFKMMTATLASSGLALSDEDALKRAPRGTEGVDDPEIALAARLKNFISMRPVSDAQIRKPALVNDFCTFASDSLPLLQWGWDALTNSR